MRNFYAVVGCLGLRLTCRGPCCLYAARSFAIPRALTWPAPLFPDLRRIPRHGLVLAWWLTWVATGVIGNVGNPDLASDVQDVSDRVLGASVATVGVVLTAVAAVLAIRVVRLVSRLQMSRSWTPWWATDPSTAPQLWRPSICSKSKELV